MVNPENPNTAERPLVRLLRDQQNGPYTPVVGGVSLAVSLLRSSQGGKWSQQLLDEALLLVRVMAGLLRDPDRGEALLSSLRTDALLDSLPLLLPPHLLESWLKTVLECDTEERTPEQKQQLIGTLAPEKWLTHLGGRNNPTEPSHYDRYGLPLESPLPVRGGPLGNAIDEWGRKVDRRTFVALLEATEQCLVSLQSHTYPSLMASACEVLGQHLGLNEAQNQCFYTLCTFLHFEDSSWEEISETIYNVLKSDEYAVAAVIATAAGSDPQIMTSLLYEGSPLTRHGLLQRKAPDRDGYRPFSTFSDKIGGRWLAPLTQRGGSIQNIAALYLQPFRENSGLSVIDFPYLAGEIQTVVQTLRNKPTAQILLWGEPGVGKNTLAAVILSVAAKNGVCPAADTERQRNNATGEWNQSLQWLHRIRLATAFLGAYAPDGSGVIVVDECEPALSAEQHKSSINDILENSAGARIWIANSLTGIHKATLRRFDVILQVPFMPFPERRRLAGRLFPAAASIGADYVAQACLTPAAILAAAGWCQATGSWTPEVIATHLRQTREAEKAARKSDDEDTWTPDILYSADNPLRADDYIGNRDAWTTAEVGLASLLTSRLNTLAKLQGFLLTGNSGCGKTHFVRCLAGATGLPLVTADAADLIAQPQRIRTLFDFASQRAPCLVLLDEIERLAEKANPTSPLPNERVADVSNLLTLLDGLTPRHGFAVFGASSQPEHIEPALLRPGRLGHHIPIQPPDKSARIQILKNYGRGGEIDWGTIGSASYGLSPALLVAVGLWVQQHGADPATILDYLRGIDTLVLGPPNAIRDMPRMAARSALHEAGHVVASWKFQRQIFRAAIDTKDGGGITHLTNVWAGNGAYPQYIQNDIIIKLAGLVTEDILCHGCGPGSGSDLERIMTVLKQYLNEEGFGTSNCGLPIELETSSTTARQNLERETEAMFQRFYKETVAFVHQYQAQIEALGLELKEKKRLNYLELEKLRIAAGFPEAEALYD